MNKRLGFLMIAALGAAFQMSMAQAPAGAPAGATGMCKDGTYSMSATMRGACSRHKGVKDWYGTASATSAAPASAAAPAGSAAPTPPRPAAAPPAPIPAPAATSALPKARYTPPANPAPGGGPGMVWVNEATKVYHCQGDRYYGKTKRGSYMTEAAARAKSYRADHGKACQQ